MTEQTVEGVPVEAQEAVFGAVVDSMGEICGAPPTQGDDEAVPSGEGLVGMISFTGDVGVTLALRLPNDAATSLAKKIAGVPIAPDTEPMADVVGELANVVAGEVVARLRTIGFRTQMGLPEVDRDLKAGSEHVTRNVAMRSEDCRYWVSVATLPA